MKMIIVLLSILIFATLASAEKLLMLPLAGDTGRLEDFRTIQLLLKESFQQVYEGEVDAAPDSAAYRCESKECAVQAATAHNAQKVVYSMVRKLGTKWILASTLMDGDGAHLYSQRGYAQNIEDFEPLCSKLASALLKHKDMEQVTSVENVTQADEEKMQNKRRGYYSGGVGFGYLYPTSKSYFSRTRDSESPVSYSQIIGLNLINSFELKPNMSLNLELTGYIPVAMGGDVNYQYFFSKGDFTPFVGGGLGLYYVRADEHKNQNVDETKQNSGPTLNAQTGLLLFRTYNIRLMLRTQYRVVFNTDMDQGISWDMCILYNQNKGESGEAQNSNAAWKYGVLFGALGVVMLAIW